MIWYFHTLQNDHHKSSYQGTIQSYYSVIITVFPMLCVYISVTHLFCNWKSVPLSLHHPFHSSPHLLLVTTSLFSMTQFVFFYFFIFFFLLFLGFTYKWNHSICLFLIYFTRHNTLPVHPCWKWQGFVFSWLSNTPSCVYVPHLLYPFTYWWVLRLLPYLGYCKHWLLKSRITLFGIWILFF